MSFGWKTTWLVTPTYKHEYWIYAAVYRNGHEKRVGRESQTLEHICIRITALRPSPHGIKQMNGHAAAVPNDLVMHGPEETETMLQIKKLKREKINREKRSMFCDGH